MDTGYTQQVLFVGTGLIVLGTALLSVCKEYYQVLLTQGICVGIGSGMLLLVSLAMLSMWFKKKKMLAAGVASTGSAISEWLVLVHPPATNFSALHYGCIILTNHDYFQLHSTYRSP